MLVLLIIPLLFMNSRGVSDADCGKDELRCHNYKCISVDQNCNGVNDCEDNSDEEKCPYFPNCAAPINFHCKSGSCINASLACNGKDDCGDFSDETVFCNKIFCDHECSYRCMKGPTGPRCVCSEGFRLKNETFCDDIDECQEYGICDQKCNNQPGSYECLCDLGYTLQEDKFCTSDSNQTVMVFAAEDEIYFHRLNSESEDSVIVSNQSQVVGVHFDGKHIYWTHILENRGAISRSLADGSHIEPLVTSGLGFCEDLDVDYVTGNIYFTDSKKGRIGVCTNNGKRCMVLTNDFGTPRAIALNPINGEMFWTEWGKYPKIARSFMDGSNQTLFVYKDIIWPNGLAIDHPNQRLYWTDGKLQTLQSITLDGKFRRIVRQKMGKDPFHPFAIAVFENNLFVSEWTKRSIQVYEKFRGKQSHNSTLKAKESFIYRLQIFDPYSNKNRTNPCSHIACSSHICLLKGRGDYTCGAPKIWN